MDMSIPQLRALERAVFRLRAAGSLEQIAALNAALAGAFGNGSASKEYVASLQEIAVSGIL